MKNNLLLTILLIATAAFYSNSQITIPLDAEVWSKFESEQLYVVLEDDEESEYSQAIKKAVESNWTFNEYEFISPEEYENLKKAGNFFLVQSFYPGKVGKKEFVLNYLELKTISEKGKDKLVGQIFQESLDTDHSGEINLTHLPLYVLSIQGLCEKGEAGSERRSVKDKMKEVAQVQTKTLYFLDLHYNEQISELADFQKLYEHDVQEITLEELPAKLKEQEDAYLFVFNKGIDKKAPILRNEFGIAQLFDMKTGEMIYYQMIYTSKQMPVGLSKYLCRVWSK